MSVPPFVFFQFVRQWALCGPFRVCGVLSGRLGCFRFSRIFCYIPCPPVIRNSVQELHQSGFPLLTFADNCRAFLHKPLLFGYRKYSRQRLHPASVRSNVVSFSSFHCPRVAVSVAGAAPLCKLSSLFVHRNVSSGIPALAVSFVARWGDRCFFVLRTNIISTFIFSLSALHVFTSASCTRKHSVIVIHGYTVGDKAPNPVFWGLTNV